ncbi:MAG: M42 family peptidase [Thermoprotei archaeon]|nr:MAG: M42 family peptidase [Thermoprotei archaeon]
MNPEVEVLRKLSEAPSPPGFEERVRGIIREMVEPYVDEVIEDSMGNLITRIGEGEPKVMLAAHMDEVGFLVTHITENGFLKIVNLGGVNPNVALGAKVVVLAEEGDRLGIVGSVPPHLLRGKREQPTVTIEDLFVDVGAESREEAEKMGIKVGTPITFHQPFYTSGNLMFGKAFDDRLGCAVLVNLAKRLESVEKGSVYLAFTVQEEVGLRGAVVASYRIAPRAALAIEGTIAADTPGIPPESQVTRTGKGPAVRIMDASVIANPRLFKCIIKVAEENKIPYQVQISPKSGTDAGRIQFAREGVAVSAVSVPARYIHSPLSMARIDDYLNTIKLLEAAIPAIIQEFSET